MTTPESAVGPALAATITALLGEAAAIPPDRRALLERLADWIAARRAAGEPAPLVFICTHNSRRSHLAQLWAWAAAAWFGLDGVATYSGGTEATALHPNAAAALARAGFLLAPTTRGPNPVYRVRLAAEGAAVEVFSKVYDAPPNPRAGFCAVMTCDAADEACPVVHGAAERIALTYTDPKLADGTPEEAATYDARCRQIGRELLWALGSVRGGRHRHAGLSGSP